MTKAWNTVSESLWVVETRLLRAPSPFRALPKAIPAQTGVVVTRQLLEEANKVPHRYSVATAMACAFRDARSGCRGAMCV